MGEVTNQIAIVLGVLVACFAGPAAALFVLIRRKAKARQSRRSPIGIALLRGPGHSLREQLDEAHNDLTWDCASWRCGNHGGSVRCDSNGFVFQVPFIVVTHDKKIIPAFTRIHHIRNGKGFEEAGEGRALSPRRCQAGGSCSMSRNFR